MYITDVKLAAIIIIQQGHYYVFSNGCPLLHLLLLLARVLEAHEVARVGREDELPVGVEVEPQRLRRHNNLALPVLDGETRAGPDK